MKISKIFHSLYAFLMFLPVCAVLGTTLYTILNPNAKDSYSGSTEFTTQEVVYQYETNEIDYTDFSTVNNSLVVGNVYYIHFTESFFTDALNFVNACNIDLGFVPLVRADSFYIDSDSSGYDTRISMQNITEGSTLRFKLDEQDGIVSTFYDVLISESVFDGDFYFNFAYECVYESSLFGSYPVWLSTMIVDEQCIDVASSFSIPYSVETTTHESETLDNAFSYSVNALYSNPLFSWCNNSFLSDPFHYIGDLFGLPRDNAINTLFSYWLNISIIWLCFDVIMYVSLLCHRWIDKGGLE